MRLTGTDAWGPAADRARAIALLRRSAELGVGIVDTADAYGPAHAEELIADALAPYSDAPIVSTKGGLTRPSRSEWVPDGRPEHLKRACEASLRRLRAESIGLYFLHHPDPSIPLEESVGALDDLRRAGKVRRVGLSNVNMAQYRRCRSTTDIAAVQNRFNLIDRTSSALAGECASDGVVFIGWGPLAGARSSPTVRSIANRHGVTPETIALAWATGRSPSVLPIPGTTSIRHLEVNHAAATVHLDPSEVKALDRVTSPPGRVRRVGSLIKSRVERLC